MVYTSHSLHTIFFIFLFLGVCYSPMALRLLLSANHLLHDDLCRLQSAGEAQNESFEYPAETEAFFYECSRRKSGICLHLGHADTA
jgi:hypothetical protein